VERVDHLALGFHYNPAIMGPSQIQTGYGFHFPSAKCSPDAISDLLSTFPKPSTTVSKVLYFIDFPFDI
jgi:hypothetical protein